MSTTLLDALPAVPVRSRIHAALATEDLRAIHALRAETFAPCKGCFECWVKTPGRCGMRDAANPLMSDIIASTDIIWTTRVRFGCWDPIAKAALDRSIGLLSPFFEEVRGETHHKARYDHYPRWGVVAVEAPGTSEADRERFRHIVRRNVLNMHSEGPWVAFVREQDTQEDVEQAIVEARAFPLPVAEVPVFTPPDPHGVPDPLDRPRHVVAWVGSAKATGESTSEGLAQALLHHLQTRGWTTELLHARRTVHLRREGAPALVEAVSRADLLILASPVYVDCLPALVLSGLDRLANAGLRAPPAILPILQSGFPELSHSALGLDVIARFAESTGSLWAGHLAVGGGGAFEGADFTELNSKAGQQARALLQAAEALDRCRPVPDEAIERFGTPLLGPRMYRMAGQMGWLVQAWQHGTLGQLGDRPFSEA